MKKRPPRAQDQRVGDWISLRCYYPSGRVRHRYIKLVDFDQLLEDELYRSIHKRSNDKAPNSEYLVRETAADGKIEFSLHVGKVKLIQWLNKGNK